MLRQGIGIAVLGVLGVVLVEWPHARSVRRGDLERRVDRSGVATTGAVTRARGYSRNYRTVTRITVRFADTEGRESWASDTLAGELTTGQRVNVRYLPDELGRRGAVVLSR
ncbi:hypothetical protein E0L36_21505 [Streptomyces sp. AJS327]|nr:hypothetical protein [Streptomyces sp. AJS327]